MELTPEAKKAVLDVIDNSKSLKLNGMMYVVVPIQLFGALEVHFDNLGDWAKRLIERKNKEIR